MYEEKFCMMTKYPTNAVFRATNQQEILIGGSTNVNWTNVLPTIYILDLKDDLYHINGEADMEDLLIQFMEYPYNIAVIFGGFNDTLSYLNMRYLYQAWKSVKILDYIVYILFGVKSACIKYRLIEKILYVH